MRFIGQFCTLGPMTASSCLDPSGTNLLPPSNGTQNNRSPATLLLPPRTKIPDWLWYGHRSPSALLYGSEYDRDDLTLREVTWHPNMRIAYAAHAPHHRHKSNRLRRMSNDASDEDVDMEDEHDLLPTPRCNSSATSPNRARSYMSAKDMVDQQPHT